MKSLRITLLQLICLAFSISASGQEVVGYSDTTWIYSFDSVSDSVLIRTEIGHAKDSILSYREVESFEYDSTLTSWRLFTTDTKAFDQQGNRNYWELLNWEGDGTELKNGSRFTHQYDSLGNIELYVVGVFSTSQGVWFDRNKQEFEYDSLRNIVLSSSYYRNLPGQDWTLASTIEYENIYDDVNHLIEQIETSSLQPNSVTKWEFTYDSEGNCIEKVRYRSGDGINFTISTREEYHYDGNGRDTLWISQYWDGIGWANEQKVTEKYDGIGNLVNYHAYRWDYATSSWLPSEKDIYTFGTDNKLAVHEHSVAPAFGAPLDAMKYDYYYNPHGNVGLKVTTHWDTTLTEWVLEEKAYTSFGNGSFTVYDSICQGEEYAWQGEQITSPGVYETTFTSIIGTDSIVTLYLDVNPVPLPMTVDGESSPIVGHTYQYTATDQPDLKYHWTVVNGDIAVNTLEHTIEVQWNVVGDGSIEMFVTNEYGCNSTTSPLNVNVGPTGIEDYREGDIVLYPVPVKSILWIRCEREFGRIEIHDSKGSIVKTTRERFVNLSPLSNGVYIVNIYNFEGDMIMVRKILKE